MINKENIKLIRELYDFAMWDLHEGKLGRRTKKDIAVSKAIDNVEKDLEVLELLKSKAELIVEDNIISIKINYINMFRDDFEKIMEWLECKEV